MTDDKIELIMDKKEETPPEPKKDIPVYKVVKKRRKIIKELPEEKDAKLVDSINKMNDTLIGIKRESAMFYTYYLDGVDTNAWIMRFIVLLLFIIAIMQYVKTG